MTSVRPEVASSVRNRVEIEAEAEAPARKVGRVDRSSGLCRDLRLGIEPVVVDLQVLAQPYRESAAGQTFITNALEDEKVTEVLILTAWVRESGMDLIAPALDVLRARGGTARLLFGVDLKGTSRQGVALAQKHFSDLYVVHDPSRTFHPKIYLALGARVGYALIGSNNLTAGGLWHNYESAMLATFNPRSGPGYCRRREGYVRKLLDDDAICKRLTRRVVQRLEDEGRLADEASDRRHRVEDRASRRQQRGRGPAPLFTSSQVEKRSRPAPVRSAPARRRIPSRSRRQLATSIDSWWKKLTAGMRSVRRRPPDREHHPDERSARSRSRHVLPAGSLRRRALAAEL